MWTWVSFLGCKIRAWKLVTDLPIDCFWHSGTLQPGHIWAKIADDAPYRSVKEVDANHE